MTFYTKQLINHTAAMAPRVAIIYYSMYGHVATLAKQEAKGIESAGGKADIYQYVYPQNLDFLPQRGPPLTNHLSGSRKPSPQK